MGLSLSRRVGERVVIDGPAVIEVAAIRGDKVRLTFEADPAVAIDREEIRASKLADLERSGRQFED